MCHRCGLSADNSNIMRQSIIHGCHGFKNGWIHEMLLRINANQISLVQHYLHHLRKWLHKTAFFIRL